MWQSPTCLDARIASLKGGHTHLVYKPEHAIELATGAVIASKVHAADRDDATAM